MSNGILEGESWIEFIRREHRRDQKQEYPDWYRSMHYTEKYKIIAQVRHDVWKLYPESFFLWTFSREGWKIGYGVYEWQSMGMNERGNLRRASNPRIIGQSFHSHTDLIGGYETTLNGEADSMLWAWSTVWIWRFTMGVPAQVLQRGLTDEEFKWQLEQVYGVRQTVSTIQ